MRVTCNVPSSNRLAPSTPTTSLDYCLPEYLQVHLIPSCKYIPELTRLWPPNLSLSLHCNPLQVHLWVHLISVSKCILKFSQWWPPSLYNSVYWIYHQTHSIVAFKVHFNVHLIMAYTFARTMLPCATLNLVYLGPHIPLETPPIIAFQSMSKFPQFRLPRLFNQGRHVQLYIYLLSISRCFSNCTGGLSAARSTICTYIDSLGHKTDAIVWCSEYSCNCDIQMSNKWIWQTKWLAVIGSGTIRIAAVTI